MKYWLVTWLYCSYDFIRVMKVNPNAMSFLCFNDLKYRYNNKSLSFFYFMVQSDKKIFLHLYKIPAYVCLRISKITYITLCNVTLIILIHWKVVSTELNECFRSARFSLKHKDRFRLYFIKYIESIFIQQSTTFTIWSEK